MRLSGYIRRTVGQQTKLIHFDPHPETVLIHCIPIFSRNRLTGFNATSPLQENEYEKKSFRLPLQRSLFQHALRSRHP